MADLHSSLALIQRDELDLTVEELTLRLRRGASIDVALSPKSSRSDVAIACARIDFYNRAGVFPEDHVWWDDGYEDPAPPTEITGEMRREFRRLRHRGETYLAIARIFGVSDSTVRRALRRA